MARAWPGGVDYGLSISILFCFGTMVIVERRDHIKKKRGAFLVRASVDVEHWYVLHTSSISSQFLVMIARVILSLCSNFGISSAANYGARHLSYFWCSKAMQPWVAKPLKG